MNSQAAAHEGVVTHARALVRGEGENQEGEWLEHLHELLGFGHQLPALSGHPEFLLLTGVADDFDRFPVGTQRALWNTNALERFDAERDELYARWRAEIALACEVLIEDLQSFEAADE